jgi:succinoglycan biosynthesis transport protein ExoP
MDIAEKTLASVSATKKGAEGDILDEKRRSVEYLAAKDEYELHKTLLSEMKQRIAISQVNAKMPRETIKIHETAEVSSSPAKPNVNLQLAIGAVLGLVFGIGLAFFLEYLDTSVKTLEDVERYLAVPVLAVIPREVGVLHKQSGMSPDAEAYRILRTNIEFNRKSADANSITIVSGGAGEGKSTTLVNLAYICAQGGYNTLMIDGDLRRPKLHTFFDINNSVGLTNYLTTDLMLEDVILQTPVDNLYFMPSGILPADAAGILNSRRMSELIADVKSRFDLVLIDSPPILGVSDASVLASEVDLTMIVIQHRKLPRSMLVRVKQAIENVGGNVLGVVLNNVDVRSDSQYQYYTSYYTYYSPTNTESKVKSRVHEVDDSYDEEPGEASAPQDAPAADNDYSDDQY